MKVAVNARATDFKIGGQQRAAMEVLKRIPTVHRVTPGRPLGGMKGHFWEQAALPLRTAGQLLWSPSATGPVIKHNQVVTLHDTAFLDLPQFFAPKFVAFYERLLPVLVRRVAKVVTVSQFSRHRIAATLSLDAERIMVIENGVSTQFRPYCADDIARTRIALDLPERYILLQATADKRKNLTRALLAWEEAQKSLPHEIELVVSGNPDRSHVFGTPEALPETGRTRFIGYVDEAHMGPLTAGAEVFLFPSLYEGFGIPIVEAMSCRTPVLTSAATATKEIAEDAALLVDPYSSEEIARGIVTLASDAALRESLVERGIDVAAKYSWDTVALKYRRLFEELGATL